MKNKVYEIVEEQYQVTSRGYDKDSTQTSTEFRWTVHVNGKELRSFYSEGAANRFIKEQYPAGRKLIKREDQLAREINKLNFRLKQSEKQLQKIQREIES